MAFIKSREAVDVTRGSYCQWVLQIILRKSESEYLVLLASQI